MLAEIEQSGKFCTYLPGATPGKFTGGTVEGLLEDGGGVSVTENVVVLNVVGDDVAVVFGCGVSVSERLSVSARSNEADPRNALQSKGASFPNAETKPRSSSSPWFWRSNIASLRPRRNSNLVGDLCADAGLPFPVSHKHVLVPRSSSGRKLEMLLLRTIQSVMLPVMLMEGVIEGYVGTVEGDKDRCSSCPTVENSEPREGKPHSSSSSSNGIKSGKSVASLNKLSGHTCASTRMSKERAPKSVSSCNLLPILFLLLCLETSARLPLNALVLRLPVVPLESSSFTIGKV